LPFTLEEAWQTRLVRLG